MSSKSRIAISELKNELTSREGVKRFHLLGLYNAQKGYKDATTLRKPSKSPTPFPTQDEEVTEETFEQPHTTESALAAADRFENQLKEIMDQNEQAMKT
jgi:hypothetical protein